MILLHGLDDTDAQRDHFDCDGGIRGAVRSKAFPRTDAVNQEEIRRHIDDHGHRGDPQAGPDTAGSSHDHQVGLGDTHEQIGKADDAQVF